LNIIKNIQYIICTVKSFCQTALPEILIKKLMRLVKDVNFNCLFQYILLHGKTE